MNGEQLRPESAHTPETRPAGAAPTDQNPHANPERAPFHRIRDAISPQSVNSAVLGGSHLPAPGRHGNIGDAAGHGSVSPEVARRPAAPCHSGTHIGDFASGSTRAEGLEQPSIVRFW